MDRVFSLIGEEEKRQRETLMLIPSENYAFPEVRKAVGSVLMHKYAEGYPGKKYYQGNTLIDQIELSCQEAALKAFGLSGSAWAVNVQPHSGAEANLAVYNALLEPGEKILSMFLYEGGHLSHGWKYQGRKITLVSKIWDVHFYHVGSETKVLDYAEIAKIAQKIKPKLIISGGTAYSREIDHKKMAQIAQKTGAFYLADIAHEAGLVVGKANKSPFPWADVVTLTTHKTLRGPRGAIIISRKQLAPKIDASVFPGIQGGPHMNTIAGIAVALGLAQKRSFKTYAQQVIKNAQVLAECLQAQGFTVVSGGTDKHLLLLDLRNKKLGGKEAAEVLEKAGIVVNKNTVPGETGSPFYPSGIRLGTPALTVRGMKEKQMKTIAEWIGEVLENPTALKLHEVKKEVKKLCQNFPLP
jgi:glycine hydroxymethyltransferase